MRYNIWFVLTAYLISKNPELPKYLGAKAGIFGSLTLRLWLRAWYL